MDSKKQTTKEFLAVPFLEEKQEDEGQLDERSERTGVVLKMFFLGASCGGAVFLAGNYAWLAAALVVMVIYLWQKAGRKADEQAHAGREKLFEKLAESLPGMVYQCRQYPTGRCVVTYSNSAVRWIYEKELKDLQKDCSSILDLVHPEDRSRVWSTLVESTIRLTPWKGEFRVMLPKQGMRWRFAHAQVERLSDGSTLWHGFIADVTWRKELEERMLGSRKREIIALKVAKETAERTERRKSEFLAVMNHEIRTPLNGILGFTEMLESTSLDKDQLSYAETIRHCGERLMAMINDSLDLTKIEAGRFEVQKVNFDLGKCVEDTFELLRPKAAQKKLIYACSYESAIPRTCIGDPIRVAQVLTNLLGNAIKFTDEGKVALIVRSAPDDDNRTAIFLTVADTGPGIPEDDLEKIFDAYYQSKVNRADSTGLGLAISRKLCELMGGELTVESEIGRGTRFTAKLYFDGAEGSAHSHGSVYADMEDASASAAPEETDARKARESAFSIL